VRRLHLDGNVVGDAGAAALADFLALPGCLLEALTLSDNQVGRRGVRALATALGVNRSLRLLDLSHNLLAPEDAAQVCAAPHPILPVLLMRATLHRPPSAPARERAPFARA
jgi:Ran GTPase-activating protein (RanGAP) involved in mRNA processing and transport